MIQLLREYNGNFDAQEVVRLIGYTNKSLFLTGKAGTGKSYLLKKITENTQKKFVILASTGVAALNVGGQTIHSFFRIEPRPYLPNDREIEDLPPEKKLLLKNLDLIIIDEISMVRADLLQAVDLSLRKNLKSPYPFAGKQLLLIGDLYQLPPVVSDNTEGEREIIEHNYETPYFYSSPSLENGYKYQIVELQKVYRQSDPQFINVLNAVRNNTVNETHLQVLNRRFIPSYEPSKDSFEITLCTTNAKADTINQQNLQRLPGRESTYTAIVTGDFLRNRNANRLPAEMELKLKAGAQIMMIKNDTNKRWVNGSIGKVISTATDSMKIKIDESGETYSIERAVWENIEYRWNKEEERIEKIVTGTFSQFPLKLAWAVTIHKSQGKTFLNAVIDMGTGAFASGQTYVALSRCTTLQGIKLKRQITRRDIICDSRIGTYFQSKINRTMERERYEAIVAGLQERLAAIEPENLRLKAKVAEIDKIKAEYIKKAEQAMNIAKAKEKAVEEIQKEVSRLKNQIREIENSKGNLYWWIFGLVVLVIILLFNMGK